MRSILAFGAVLGLAACMDGAEMAETGTSQEIEVGRQMLIFFQSGFDEPPVSFTIVPCEAGRCVTDGSDTAALQRVDGGYIIEIYDATYTLTPSGGGFVDPPNGEILGISWLTERSA